MECLRTPLARRGPAMGTLVGFDFAPWLELAERHSLTALKTYCLVSWRQGWGCAQHAFRMAIARPQAVRLLMVLHLTMLPSICCCEQECLMHLLVAPGSSGRIDEPKLHQIDWTALKCVPQWAWCLCLAG